MSGFRASSGGVTARFARPEAAIIRDLVGQVVELVVADMPAPDADELAAMVGFSDSSEVPDDPVLARLLPDGYRDDPDSAQEFRRFTESGLRSAKVESAQTLLQTLPASGGKVKLTVEQAEAWLRSLNDVRLALGVRLGVTDDFDGLTEDLDADDPRFAYIQVYQWLAFLQESLVAALS
ncbi:MAG TPA: DUF2017 domain-containing protein [Streptosporangiaceae bacterium]|jgi:hypothetical protein|nr:DUF2017 domain-containing protein [Streptosporangiaceae bacterium]